MTRAAAAWAGREVVIVLACLLAPAPAIAQEARRGAFDAALNRDYVIHNLETDMFVALRELSIDVVVVDADSLLHDEARPGVSAPEEGL